MSKVDKLNKFLEKHCCKEQYWGNVKRDRFYPKYSPAENSSMIEKEFFDTSFVWKETVQGWDYWNKIDKLWQNILKRSEFEMTKVEEFNNFLEQHNCKDGFYRNRMASLGDNHLEDHYVQRNLIRRSFSWSETPEGHSFWALVNYAWMEKFKND